MSLSFIKNRISILVSSSNDGKTMAQVLNTFGINTVLGSSTKGGYSGFKALERNLKENQCVGLAVDGPRGPRREVKKGIILLAKHTGKPILPILFKCNHSIVFKKSWDNFFIPYPFTKTVMIYGRPIYIPKDINKEDIGKYCYILKQELESIEQQAEKIMSIKI